MPKHPPNTIPKNSITKGITHNKPPIETGTTPNPMPLSPTKPPTIESSNSINTQNQEASRASGPTPTTSLNIASTYPASRGSFYIMPPTRAEAEKLFSNMTPVQQYSILMDRMHSSGILNNINAQLKNIIYPTCGLTHEAVAMQYIFAGHRFNN